MKRPFSSLQLLKQTPPFCKVKFWMPRKDMRAGSALFKCIAGMLLVSIGLVSCRTGRPGLTPQILTFNYTVLANVNASDLVRDVQNGTRTIASLIGANPCNLTANFAPPLHPSISVNGTPGQMGFNVSIVSVNPTNITTTNPPSCIAIRQLQIAIGGPSQALALGTETTITEGEIILTDGRDFSMGQLFRGRVRTFDASTRRASGDFSFITSLSGNANTVLVAEGSYAMTP